MINFCLHYNREPTRHEMPPDERTITTYDTVLAKKQTKTPKTNLNLIKPLALTTNFRKCREEHVSPVLPKLQHVYESLGSL